MNVYAIRIENDETVVVMAASAEEALRLIGLPACLLLALEHPSEGQEPPLKKPYKVMELNHLHLHFRCTPEGVLDLYDADPLTYDSLFELHPRVKLPAMGERD